MLKGGKFFLSAEKEYKRCATIGVCRIFCRVGSVAGTSIREILSAVFCILSLFGLAGNTGREGGVT